MAELKIIIIIPEALGQYVAVGEIGYKLLDDIVTSRG